MFFIFYKGEFISFWVTGKFETSAYLGSTEVFDSFWYNV